jgi:hypothetical protein
MTEQEFQELSRNLYATVGLSETKSRSAATWVLAAHGFVADAVDCLPHLVFVGPPKVARDRAVRLVAASVEDLLVEVTRVQKRRGIILIEDYEERSKSDEEGAEIVRDLLLRPETPMRRPILMGCGRWPAPESAAALVISFDTRS